MKKTILATMLALAAVTASAQVAVTIDQQNTRPEVSGPESNQTQLAVKAPINKLLSIDGSISSQTTDNTNVLSTRIEGGLTAQQEIVGPFDGYGRLALGQKNKGGADSFNYYSGEVGAVYHTPVKGLDAKVGYRYRSGFGTDGNKDQTNTMRYNLGYSVTDKDVVGVRYDDVRGDGANKTTGVYYTRKF